MVGKNKGKSGLYLLSNNPNKVLHWATNKNGNTVHYSSQPEASLMRRFAVYITGLLPVESLL